MDMTFDRVDWEAEHSRLHAMVDHLQSKSKLTNEDEVRLREMKKQKLVVKDKLETLGRSF